MADESVIFEVQVDRKTLEQIFKENQHLKDSYDKIVKSETLKNNVNTLKNEIENLKQVVKNLKDKNTKLTNVETLNKKLFQENGNLEQQIKILTRKLRLEEERNKSNDLAHVECKVLKLKLHTLETEKNHLLTDFENERRIITLQNKPRVAKLEENIHHLRKWIEKESQERRPKESQEVKQLKEQIKTLENEKTDLIEGFELERSVFRKILQANGNFDLP